MTASEPTSPKGPSSAADVLYGLAGLVSNVTDAVPHLVEDGRRKVEPQLRQARFLGELAVSYSKAEVTRRTKATLSNLSKSTPAATERPAGAATSQHTGHPTEEQAEAVAAVIEGYDTLTAADVVRLVETLTPAERAVVEAYETAGRGRRTILSRIAQLQASGE